MTDTIPEVLSKINERWENLTIADDFVFCKAMLNADLCREVLEAVLGVAIERIDYIGRQEDLDASPAGKGIRLDVYVRDGAGTVYNVEMQSTDTRELPQRSRYYHALMSLDQLGKGLPYRSLKDSYVIFVCGFDPFKCGRRVYSFENTCQDVEGLRLDDGCKTIFLSATAPRQEQAGDRLNEFLDYVATGKVSGGLSARLAEEVAEVLDNQKWRLEFMMLQVRDQLNFDRGVLQGREEGLEQGRAEGLAEGREQGKAEGLSVGREQGEERLSRLIAALAADGRTDDVARAATDRQLREELYRNYDIA